MDSNKPRNSDESSCDRIAKRSEDDIDQYRTSSHQDHIRSYICSFCMRGFSNAQALGGHMNIHRRDRAKLRQLLEDKEDTIERQDLVCESEKKDFVDDKSGFRVEENKLEAAEQAVELPDFIGIASRIEEERSKEQSNSSSCDQNKEEIVQVMRDGSSSSDHEIGGLDLELRLGQSLKNTSDTRKL